MKRKPSDYSRLRYLKKENLLGGGSIFVVTDFEEVNKSTEAGEEDLRIRLTLDEHWWFELKGENLNTVIDLLGDDFALWLHGRIGLCRGEFTARDGKVIDYIQVIPAPEVALKRRPAATTRAKDNDEIPFS
jgi:hypothetical protein